MSGTTDATTLNVFELKTPVNNLDPESRLLHALREMEITTFTFTGSVTLHFNQGGLTDIDRLEKSLKKKGKK